MIYLIKKNVLKNVTHSYTVCGDVKFKTDQMASLNSTGNVHIFKQNLNLNTYTAAILYDFNYIL